MRVVSEEKSVPVRDMKDGDIAVTTDWSHTEYIGKVVQRYGTDLIMLGEPYGKGWGLIWNKDYCALGDDCRVRILPKGTLLEV